MTLRTRLALALTFSALLPMGVAVGLPMLQADRRAQEDASRRLESTRRQAAILVQRQRDVHPFMCIDPDCDHLPPLRAG